MKNTFVPLMAFAVGVIAGVLLMQVQVVPKMTAQTFQGYEYGKQLGRNEAVATVSNQLRAQWQNTGEIKLLDENKKEIIFVEKKSE